MGRVGGVDRRLGNLNLDSSIDVTDAVSQATSAPLQEMAGCHGPAANIHVAEEACRGPSLYQEMLSVACRAVSDLEHSYANACRAAATSARKFIAHHSAPNRTWTRALDRTH